MIGQIVNILATVLEIQDGGDRHLELWLLKFFFVKIKLATFLLNLMMNGQ